MYKHDCLDDIDSLVSLRTRAWVFESCGHSLVCSPRVHRLPRHPFHNTSLTYMHPRIYTRTHEQDVGAGAAVGHHFDGEPPPPSILDELRKLRDENRQLRHEKSAWADAQKAIERDLAAADSEAQQASRRIEDLERELRKQSGWVTARINIDTCTPCSFVHLLHLSFITRLL